MQFVDTHCHIHSDDYKLDAEDTYKNAMLAGVTKLVTVGTDVADSTLAVQWALAHKKSWASVGVHPHEAKHGSNGIENLLKDKTANQKIVAVGEIGLDYFYSHSPREQQVKVLEQQIQMALDNNLPIIFHLREAFEDFWPIFSGFQGIKGVLHSFTDTAATLERALSENLFIGVNGISTFTKDIAQKDMYQTIPLESLLLETDAPYLTPLPHRGKVNEPAYVSVVAEHVAKIHSTSVEIVATQTTHNANNLFHI